MEINISFACPGCSEGVQITGKVDEGEGSWTLDIKRIERVGGEKHSEAGVREEGRVDLGKVETEETGGEGGGGEPGLEESGENKESYY